MSEVIDNRAHRIRVMKEIIRHLHAGHAPEQVKARLRDMVRQTDYSEIVAMEQELMAEGMPASQIQSLCDLHSQVTREVMAPAPAREAPPGHPVDTFRRENAALAGVVSSLRAAAREVLEAAGEDAGAALRFRQAYNDLTDIEKHYQRKEHTVFSRLERHGIGGPSKVMWGKDDEVRALLKKVGAMPAGREAATLAVSLAAAVEEMIYKEENILLPMCLDVFTEEDWAEIWSASPRYGWCLVAPREGYRPAAAVLPEAAQLATREAVMLPTGNLSLEQLTAIFATLPVDLTFVDADDRVGFFSEGPDRVFARSRAIIGRRVQNCHPPRSVDVVDRILADLREGRQNVAEFWIDFQGRFVHIRYLAVRGEDGRYLGTLEVTQDASRIRQLAGERRLLEYDPPAAGR